MIGVVGCQMFQVIGGVGCQMFQVIGGVGCQIFYVIVGVGFRCSRWCSSTERCTCRPATVWRRRNGENNISPGAFSKIHSFSPAPVESTSTVEHLPAPEQIVWAGKNENIYDNFELR